MNKLQGEKEKEEQEKKQFMQAMQGKERENMGEKHTMLKHIEQLQAATERMKKENRELMEQMNRQTQVAMKHEDERNNLRGQIDIAKKESQPLQQHIQELKEKHKSEEEGKKVMMAQFQAQESKVTQGLREVQNSSVQERTLLHKQLQDANVKLALAAEALMKANAQTAEMSRMEQQVLYSKYSSE